MTKHLLITRPVETVHNMFTLMTELVRVDLGAAVAPGEGARQLPHRSWWSSELPRQQGDQTPCSPEQPQLSLMG